MTRLICHAFALLVVLASVTVARAQSLVPDDDTTAIATDAGVDAIDLLGAVYTTGYDARTYLCLVDEGPCPKPPTPACGWPICGALGQRLFCVEAMESGHGQAMWNPVGLWYGNHIEHAQGWLGFMPTTAATWGARIGDRLSEWMAAARMIAAGRGAAFAGIAWGRC